MPPLLKIDDAILKRLAADASTGASLADIAAANRIAPMTLSNYLRIGSVICAATDNGEDVGGAAIDLGVSDAYAKQARSVYLAIEQARSRARIEALGLLQAAAQPIYDPAALPAKAADQKAISAWMQLTAPAYRGGAASASSAPAGSVSISMSLADLDQRLAAGQAAQLPIASDPGTPLIDASAVAADAEPDAEGE